VNYARAPFLYGCMHAQNHGGPFPASGHPAFTAVGIPASLMRFGALRCYDNVREHRLPPILRDSQAPATGGGGGARGFAQRLIDGEYTTRDITATGTKSRL
jgi:NADP-dependent aldehyde dehydrogenase